MREHAYRLTGTRAGTDVRALRTQTLAQADRQAGRQTDREAGSPAGRQEGKQASWGRASKKANAKQAGRTSSKRP
eukprot:2464566-Alexandrium_andersonii.AAC.1